MYIHAVKVNNPEQIGTEENDMSVEAIETYKANGIHARLSGLNFKGYCSIRPTEVDGWYERETQGHSVHGRRYHYFPSYDEALDAAFIWAKRRARKEA